MCAGRINCTGVRQHQATSVGAVRTADRCVRSTCRRSLSLPGTTTKTYSKSSRSSVSTPRGSTWNRFLGQYLQFVLVFCSSERVSIRCTYNRQTYRKPRETLLGAYKRKESNDNKGRLESRPLRGWGFIMYHIILAYALPGIT